MLEKAWEQDLGLQWRMLGYFSLHFHPKQVMEFTAIFPNGDPPRKRAYHTCSIVGDALYILGGITGDKTVLSDMFRYEISSNSWTHIEDSVTTSRTSPSRALVSAGFPKGRLCIAPRVSHHTATVVKEHYILVIGGWNGRRRCADVFCYNTVDRSWHQIPESGDVPVGLSSHTATLISSKEVLIIGREGGVHTQRRFSGAFYLNFETGKYTEAPFHAASRSGHIASLLPIRGSKESHLFVLGGRKSGGYEFIGLWGKIQSPQCSIPKNKTGQLLEKSIHCEEPSGRQHAKAVNLDRKHLFVFGGETWSGARENVTSDAFILETDKMRWYRVAHCGEVPKLVGHSIVGFDGRIFVFGGGVGNKYCNNLWEVKF